jgi:hypothetical protein
MEVKGSVRRCKPRFPELSTPEASEHLSGQRKEAGASGWAGVGLT